MKSWRGGRVENVSNWTQTVPATESQARPLAMLSAWSYGAKRQATSGCHPPTSYKRGYIANVVSPYPMRAVATNKRPIRTLRILNR